jgi:hypothetical protein
VHCPPKPCTPCKPKEDDHCHVRKDHDHKDHCHVRKDHDHKDHSKGVCHLKTHDIDKCFAHQPHFSAFCA